jgi:hypothetical protein
MCLRLTVTVAAHPFVYFEAYYYILTPIVDNLS